MVTNILGFNSLPGVSGPEKGRHHANSTTAQHDRGCSKKVLEGNQPKPVQRESNYIGDSCRDAACYD
ncbi:MAG: hypothetical protein RBT36_11050 [Desulfobulbus sp.]|nr:hypothetical protein [Desulfobulbus sp.]